MDGQGRRRGKQVEEGMWSVLRRNLLVKREASVAAAASSFGLWKAPHVSQCCNWDCGVACVQMVLRGLGREGERSSLLAALGTRSVWTIDLAMLLHRFGVRFMYCTRTAGVTEAYSTIDFYRTNFDRDAPRVQGLFEAANDAKVGAVQKAFSWRELSVLLSRYDYAAIVLVDSRHLHPTGRRTPSPQPPLLSPPSPASTAYSTPKRRREDAAEEGDSDGAEVRTDREKDESGALSRRLRRRKPKGYVDVDPGNRGEGAVGASCSGAADPTVHAAVGRASPSPILSGEWIAEETTEDPSKARNLRVSPAPHAVDGDVIAASPFVTPPAPRLGRKVVAEEGAWGFKDPIGGTEDSALHPSSFSPIDPPSPSTSPSATSTEDGRAFVSPPCSPVLASPPEKTEASAESSYCGHYLLLVGWSEADGVFIARDPALPSSPASNRGSPASLVTGIRPADDPSAHVCLALTPEALDRARRSYGTDEDVLVIDLARSKKGGVAAAPLAAVAAATALAASAASSAAAASALVGLFAMAAAAAAARGEASGFKEWAWPDPYAWFGGQAAGVGNSADAAASARGNSSSVEREGSGGSATTAASRVRVAVEGLTQGGAEAAARKLASFLSLAPIGWRFSMVGDAYRGPRVWRTASGGGASDAEAEVDERERWAARVANAVEGLLEGGRRAAYTMEGLLQGGANTMEGLLEGGRRAAYTMEGLLQGGAYTMEGLLEGGRRAAYTMEGLLEGGRRAAYILRDSLADVADAPGGAGAECCASMARDAPGSPITPINNVGAAMSPA